MAQKNNHLRHPIKMDLLSIFILPILLFAITSSVLYAKEKFEFTPSLSIDMGYSDNLDQESSDRKSSFFSGINPGLQVKREGGRVKAKLDYVLNSFVYSNKNLKKSKHNNNRLQSTLLTELLQNSLFLNLNGSISQELLDATQSASSSLITGSGNTTETHSYSINPYWQTKLGQLVNARIGYDYNQVLYEKSPLISADDSEQYKITVLVEKKSVRQLSWKLDMNYEQTDYRSSLDTQSSTVVGTLGFEISQQIKSKLLWGYEKYDGIINNDKGALKGLGLIWNPSKKTYFDFTYGQRFYGDSYDLSIKHQFKKLGVNLRYNESFTNARNQIRSNNVNLQNGLFNQDEVLDQSINANDPGVSVPVNSQTSSLYLSKRYTTDLTYKMVTADIKLGVYYENRLFDQVILNETDYGVDVTWNLKLGRRMNAVTYINWVNKEFIRNNNQLTSEERLIRWSLSRRLTRKLTAKLSLSYQNKLADIQNDVFEERIILLNLNQLL